MIAFNYGAPACPSHYLDIRMMRLNRMSSDTSNSDMFCGILILSADSGLSLGDGEWEQPQIICRK